MPSPTKAAWIPEPHAAVAAPRKARIGKRFIPVVGGLMVATIAMSRLVRRGRGAR